MQPRRSPLFRLAKLLFVVAVFAALIAGWLHRYDLYDWWRLRGYQAPATIATLADHTTMTPRTRKLFYAYHPALEDRATFSSHCPVHEQTIVLGCYINTRGIYVFAVTDARLRGVEEVTAAHETLHAAYARLDSKTKAHIDALEQQALATVTDQRIKDTVAAYHADDPSVVPNELHSILGTELAQLPPELEAYYAQYFTNRAAIVAYSNTYEGEFTSRKTAVQTADTQLATIKQQIDANEAALATQHAQLTSQQQSMEQLSRQGRYAEFNGQVEGFNNAVGSYNVLAKQTQQIILSYNDLVQKRNALALEVRDLAQAIDSRPQNFNAQ